MLQQLKWPTLIALPVLAAATYFNWYFVWGALFVFWGLISAIRGEAYLVEPLFRGQQPVLFWIVSLMWLAFGIWYVWADLSHRF